MPAPTETKRIPLSEIRTAPPTFQSQPAENAAWWDGTIKFLDDAEKGVCALLVVPVREAKPVTSMNYAVRMNNGTEMAQFKCLIDAITFARHLGTKYAAVWPMSDDDSVMIASDRGGRFYI